MPNENASLRFTFTKVDKDILKIVLDEANKVTQEDIDRLVPEVRELFVNARTNAQEVYDDPSRNPGRGQQGLGRAAKSDAPVGVRGRRQWQTRLPPEAAKNAKAFHDKCENSHEMEVVPG
ncbi:hypothetical protein [Anaeromassilibacillus sp. SJQ-1]|uniref:hypothetical protein n=1 Tax=Anaeromassilibacillus sp. SJQ-1 TaxID=3375419 RepID=UPI003989B46B